MKTLNKYFFGSEQIALSDGLWFYGSFAAILIIGIGSIILSGGMMP